MADQERLFAVFKNKNQGNTHMTSFADSADLDAYLEKNIEKVELVDSSTDYKGMLKILDQDAPPSLMERVVEQSTNSNGDLNSNTLHWFLKKLSR